MSKLVYIGDIAKADAKILATYASRSRNILEFGVGGSTMLIAQAMPDGARFTSVDTNDWWIAQTAAKIDLIGARPPTFVAGSTPPVGSYDFVFVDGIDEFRLTFALRAWPMLTVGGAMAFHDTRRAVDVRNVIDLTRAFQSEVKAISFNEDCSNISIVEKRAPLVYEDWSIVEQKPRWASGYDEAPSGWLDMNPPSIDVHIP